MRRQRVSHWAPERRQRVLQVPLREPQVLLREPLQEPVLPGPLQVLREPLQVPPELLELLPEPYLARKRTLVTACQTLARSALPKLFYETSKSIPFC